MTRYRKKPVVIEAFPVGEALRCAAHDWDGLPDWLADAYENGAIIFAADHVIIPTLEGSMRGDRPDQIIRGVQGELYPCKPDIFAATYDKETA